MDEQWKQEEASPPTQEFDNGRRPPEPFPVNLLKDEYVRFNMIISQQTGLLRFRRGQLILYGITLGLCVLMFVSDLAVSGKPDSTMLSLILVLGLIGGLLLFGMPLYLKHNAQKAYDENTRGSQSFYGWITVYSDRMEKKSAQGTVSIPYRDNVLYIETKDMMILFSSNAPAIVLPARCMTPEFVERVRQAVLPAIPAQRLRLIDRMVSLAQTPIAPPQEGVAQEGVDEPPLMELEISYKQEEFVHIATEGALRAYLKMLPVYSVTAIVGALTFGILYNFLSALIAFVIISLLPLFGQLLSARSRAKGLFNQLPENGARIRMQLNTWGIVMKSSMQEEALRLSWEMITRAVERPDCVEFHTRNALFQVPKRCIEDMDALRKVVDTYFIPPTKKRT